MENKRKIKRRGFVMTGGGAKGLFEAGVIHAFHITGMEFDVITGSSIGAMNSIFFAEYLLRKRELPAEQRATPEATIQAMEGLIRSYHRAWLLMPEKNIIDDSPNSPLGALVEDLGKFNLNLADLTKIGWWWKDPKRGAIPGPQVFPAALRTGKELVKRFGKASELLRIFRDHRQDLLRETTRTYLKRFRLERSLIPAGGEGDQIIKNIFTQPVTPLQREHLSGPVGQEIQPPGKAECLIDPQRTFKDFTEHEITVRLTRANYRTGRLEISAYLASEDFARYMEKQAWRLDVADSEKMPLGSFRLQLPGNPNVIKAALASGRFPGVFAPFPFQEIYPKESIENELLYKLLKDWIEDPEVQASLKQAYQKAHHENFKEEDWQKLLKRWQKSKTIRDFFPYETDAYLDGGSIDNTPSNSAVDATREWIDSQGIGKRDVMLDLYVIFLEAEPKISRDEAQEPLLTEVVKRTLDVQAAAVKTGDAVVVKTINSFGNQAEALARTLLSLLEALKEIEGRLDDQQRQSLEDAVRKIAIEQGQRGYLGGKSQDILIRMENWANEVLRGSLPLDVEEIRIYPDRMPLTTLSFTERLGYRKDRAIDMLTMGCYDTLWALRIHLEDQAAKRDQQDEQVLQMTKKWMGFETLPDKRGEDYNDQLESLRQGWRCTHSECLFYKTYCKQSQGETAS
jgi:predicted acylesterase/phospholipase RssA